MADGIGQNPPPEGWEGPDERGFMKYTMHGGSGNTEPPEVSGMECFFVAVVGHYYTRWTYRPVPVEDPRYRVPEPLDNDHSRCHGSHHPPAPSPTRGVTDPGPHPSGFSFARAEHGPHVPEQVRDRISDSDPREDALIALAEVEQAREMYLEFKDQWLVVGKALRKLDVIAWANIDRFFGWDVPASGPSNPDTWMSAAEDVLRDVYSRGPDVSPHEHDPRA